MNSYSIYAKFYDAVEGKQEDKVKFLHNLINEFNPNADSLLEIACGTGNIISGLIDKFNVVEGLDISGEMISIAKKKLPNIKIYEKDMRNFNLDKKYDVVLCIYDSLNHLTDINDWEKTFKSVYDHLEDKGLFIFDLNTEFRLLVIEDLSPYVIEFDDNYMIMEVDRKTEEIYTNTLRIFEKNKDEKFTLHEETIKEATFAFEKIEKRLEEYFTVQSIRAFDNNNLSEIPPHKFVICQKRKQ